MRLALIAAALLAGAGAARAAPDALTVPLEAVLEGRRVIVLGAETIDSCPGAWIAGEIILGHLAEAEQALAYVRPPHALEHVLAIRAALPCLAEPLAPELLARGDYLFGILAYRDDSEDLAARAWERALVIAPDLRWDENYPPEQQERFEAARAAVELRPRAELRVVPWTGDASLWVDGRSIAPDVGALSLPPGEHLVQVEADGWETIRLRLEGDATYLLALPAAMGRPAAAWLRQPELEEILGEMLQDSFPDGTPLRLDAGVSRWQGAVGGEWARVSRVPRWVTAAGEAAVVVGVAGMSVSAIQRQQAERAYEEAHPLEGYEEALRAEGRIQMATDNLRASIWITAGGATLTVSGLALQRLGSREGGEPR